MGNSTILLWFAFFGLQVIKGTVRSEERKLISTIVRFAYAGTGTHPFRSGPDWIYHC